MSAPRDSLRPILSPAVAFLVFLFALLPAAHADGLQDAAKLLKQGQRSQALEQVERHLSTNPKDAQGRFLKGVILTEMNRTQEAIGIFTKLTEDYPELPEPYNNLAVIHAQQKNYDKARQALEMAIRTHPSYATAHENLGDIYARMASQAYDKALQLDSSNTTALTKLAMIRELMSVAPRGGRSPASPPAKTPANPTPLPVPASPPAPVVVAEAPKPPPAPAAEAKRPVTPPPVVASEPAAPTASPAQDDIARAVDAWASAWSSKDVRTYLGYYAPAFKPPGGMKRAAWEAERRSRVTKPGSIKVSVEGLTVRSEGADRALVKFRQNYRSASLKSSSGKVLVMVRINGKWLIEQERIGG